MYAATEFQERNNYLYVIGKEKKACTVEFLQILSVNWKDASSLLAFYAYTSTWAGLQCRPLIGPIVVFRVEYIRKIKG
jgi:hypothetical protein